MSGGSLGYFYCSLQEHVGDFCDKELDELVRDLADLFYEREWYLSSDTGVGSWNEARDKFKKKWFTELGREERIERYLTEITDEVRKSFGISNRYCRYCEHWSERKDKSYGDCSFQTHCLTHRMESCNKFEERKEP